MVDRPCASRYSDEFAPGPISVCVPLSWKSTTSYQGYLTQTTSFATALTIGSSVSVAAAALQQLSTIGGDLTVGNNASIDFSGCAVGIDVGGAFNLNYGTGKFGQITSIAGAMTLAGDVTSSILPAVTSVPSLTLRDFVGPPGSIIVTDVATLVISGTSGSFNYDLTSLSVSAVLEINVPVTSSLVMALGVAELTDFTLTSAPTIQDSFFPSLATVSDTFWIRNVANFAWDPARVPLTVQNLIVGNPFTSGQPSTVTSLGGLSISAWGDVVIQYTGLSSLAYLSGVTTLRSLTIVDNGNLQSLAGLESLHTVTGDVLITRNRVPLDISALGGLAFVGGSLLIENGQDRYTTLLQICPCDTCGLFCTLPLSLYTFDEKLTIASAYVDYGDAFNSTGYMAQGLICAKALPTNGDKQVALVSELVSNITTLSFARNVSVWNIVGFDALIFLKTQLLGPTTSTFVPMEATDTLISRMNLFVQAYTTAEEEYQELLDTIDKKEALVEWRQKQLARTSALVQLISNNYQMYINERDDAIDQMVTAGEEVDSAAVAMATEMEAILVILRTAATPLSAGLETIQGVVNELKQIGSIMSDFKKDTSNTTGSQPPATSGLSDSGLTSLAYLKATGRLLAVVGKAYTAASGSYDSWVAANVVLDDLHNILEDLYELIEYIERLEEAINSADNGGSVSNLTALLNAGDFGTIVDWMTIPKTLSYSLSEVHICYAVPLGWPSTEQSCGQLSTATELLAIWGSQITYLASVTAEYERAIATSKTALSQLARYNQEMGYLLDGLEQMTDESIAQATQYAEQFMATISSVALYELQQVCASLDYYDPSSQRVLDSCDVSNFYVGMSSRELQRRLSSVTFAYSVATKKRHTLRESYIPKIDVTHLIGGNLSQLLSGTSVTFTITPDYFVGPLGTGQNAEWKYVFVELADVPATMGIPDAPNVDIGITLQSPFTKIERFTDGSSVMHTFTLWGTHSNFAFRAKQTSSDTCIASVAVPGNLAPDICQDGITDGLYSPDYQLPAPFCTVVLHIANVQQILAYSPDFFENVTTVYIGGVVITNPRPYPLPQVFFN